MINKALRIMIVDSEHVQRLRLERDFNRQGYYAIAPVSGLDDMVTLLDYGDRGFDWVLINANLNLEAVGDLQTFCLDHPLMRQVCIYHLAPQRLAILDATIKGRRVFNAVQLPGGAPIGPFVSAAASACLSVVP